MRARARCRSAPRRALDRVVVAGGECKPLKKEFIACLKSQGNEHIACKDLSRRYLECRMDRGLMARASAGAFARVARAGSRAPIPQATR